MTINKNKSVLSSSEAQIPWRDISVMSVQTYDHECWTSRGMLGMGDISLIATDYTGKIPDVSRGHLQRIMKTMQHLNYTVSQLQWNQQDIPGTLPLRMSHPTFSFLTFINAG